MDQERNRNLGVTEARFALTILTCLLVAIGYIALLRLGGTKDPTVDLSTDVSPPSVAGPDATPVKTEPPPRVLPLDPIEPTTSLAKRPPSGDQPVESERR